MSNGRTVNSGERSVALTFLVVGALLISSIGATYWAGLRAVKRHRELAARRLVIQRWDEIRSMPGGTRTAEEAEFDQAVLAADKAAATGTAVFILTALLNLVFLALAYRQIAKEIRRREAAIVETGRQKELLATTLASIGDGVIITDTEARITFVNRAAASLTGWSADEAQGMAVTEVFRIVNEETRATVGNPVAEVLRTGAVVGLVNPTLLIRRDGRELLIDDSGAPICGADGQTRGVVLVFRDITHRQRAEAALRQNEDRFHTMADSIPNLAWWTNGDGYVTWYNRRWYEYTGTTPEQMQDWGWQSVHDPAVLPEVLQRWTASIAAGEPFDMTFPLRGADGVFRPFLTRIMPLKDELGRVVRWFGTSTDVSDQKRMERLQARLAAIVESSDDAILSKDLHGIIQTWNVGADRLFGYRAEEVIGQPITLLLPPERMQEEEQILELVRSGQHVEHLETVRVTKDGRPIDVSVTVSPVKDQDGQIIAASTIAHDITDRKRAEASLLEAKTAAEEANQAKSEFLANMSHELRTPMNAILGMIDVALPKASDPMVQDCLQTAKGSADLLLTLLNDLLDSAKIDSGKLELESAPFSLRRMLDQTTQVLAVRASEKGLAFYCRVPDEAPDAVTGDRIRLQQVLLNLAGNAIKFTERGEVELRLRARTQDDEAHLEFAVRDTGIGIPPSQLELVFQPFAQADASMTRRFGGTGLGLSICKNLVEMMGGRIWVESAVEKGSMFHFTVRLPLARELPSDLEAPVAVLMSACTPLRILLVEDNPANQKLATYILRDRGHLVEIAGDGPEAIDLTERNRYDVILMDIQMPGMNGLEATAAIRNRENGGARVPIIAMTAHAMKGDRERCLAQGMDGYLAKPIEAREMIALVESLATGSAPPVLESPAPTEPAGPPSAAVFDPELALKRCAGSKHLLADMAQCFVKEARDLLPQMRAAAENGDLATAGRLAHRLKGTIVYLGAESAENAVITVEKFQEDGGKKAEAEEAVRALQHECQLLESALGLREGVTTGPVPSPVSGVDVEVESWRSGGIEVETPKDHG